MTIYIKLWRRDKSRIQPYSSARQAEGITRVFFEHSNFSLRRIYQKTNTVVKESMEKHRTCWAEVHTLHSKKLSQRGLQFTLGAAST